MKIKLMSGGNLRELENQINKFVEDKVVLDIRVEEGYRQYVATILYKNLDSYSSGSRVVPVSNSLYSAEEKEPCSPFDKLSRGGKLNGKQ